MSTVQQNAVKYKIGLLNLAAELGNVSRTWEVMGFLAIFSIAIRQQ